MKALIMINLQVFTVAGLNLVTCGIRNMMIDADK